jgi:hypothetical protein
MTNYISVFNIKMKLILVLIIILFLILLRLKSRENFKALKMSKLLDTAAQSAENPTVKISGEAMDDDMLIAFLKETDHKLEYPEEEKPVITNKESLDDVEKVKLNYEHLIEKKTNEQKVKLTNLLYELKMIDELESKLKCE